MARVRGRARWDALLVLSLLFSAFARDAAAQTWTGLGADNNWSTAANWGGTAPASSATTVVHFAAPAPRQSPVVDAPWIVNTMYVSGGFQFSGQTLTFAGTTPQLQITGISTTIANPVVLTGAFILDGFGANVALTGGITGTGPLGIGGQLVRCTLRGVNTYAGGTTVTGGAALVVGGTVPGPVTVTLLDSFLGGAGTIGGPVIVSSSATFAPGSIIGGILNVGDLTLASTMAVSISGTTQGVQYGSANVTGTVDLTGSSLSLSGSYTPATGDVFTIITNDGTDPVVGAFAGLPEGATTSLNGSTLRVSYVGGTGNDVTLTTISGAVPGTPIQTPTLSQWALIVLAAAMLMMGAWHARRHGLR